MAKLVALATRYRQKLFQRLKLLLSGVKTKKSLSPDAKHTVEVLLKEAETEEVRLGSERASGETDRTPYQRR